MGSKTCTDWLQLQGTNAHVLLAQQQSQHCEMLHSLADTWTRERVWALDPIYHLVDTAACGRDQTHLTVQLGKPSLALLWDHQVQWSK